MSEAKKHALARLAGVLAALLLVTAAMGCQSMERMSRPDAAASLERPEDWPRERQEETHGVLFEIRHPEDPVRVRLRRLESPLVAQAHSTWATMWLDALYDDLSGLQTQQTQLNGEQATRLGCTVVHDTDEWVVEMFVVNAGGESFALEAWGPRAAMDATAETRQRIVDSVELPGSAEPPAPEKSSENPADVSAGGWRLELPAVADDEIMASWQVERMSGGRVVFELPSRLIEGELFIEELDYPIDAARYAKIALDLDEAPATDAPHNVTRRVDDDDDQRVPMVHIYRFVTRGERAVQVVVSTPKPLYDNNRAVVDQVIESLGADPKQASSRAGDADSGDDASDSNDDSGEGDESVE